MNRAVLRSLLASPARNLVLGTCYMAVIFAAGTLSYIEQGWSWADAIYMVVVTIYTVGYGEVRPIDSPSLRATTIMLIVLGCTGMIFLTGALVQFFTISQLQQFLGSKRMQNQIDGLDRHVIICGYGRIGLMLAHELSVGGVPYVIVERDKARCEQARGLGHLYVQGDATEEETLRGAGIDRARALATVLPNDAANVFITLSARSLNKALQIIARGEVPTTESKLRYAGADKVIMPTHIGAERIAEEILFPDMARFIGSERMQEFEKEMRLLGLDLEMVTVAPKSPAAGRSVLGVEQEAEGAFYIVGINRQGGERIARPGPKVPLHAGDGVVVIGRGERARAYYRLFNSP